ncbi:recombinase family protein [Halobacillus litoralis]|uniref:recombinase family protein n=1 Tax=Halobacillus litoralis TaxID=45668 RepID=UPI001CD24601|nr:recombinase family protein [Halobacillus litoralis]MCA1022127.1 recombinase family protein [Halobacillus litoralis]
MRCAVYIRVSTDKIEQKQSLENQRDLFIKYVSEKGWDLEKIYVDVESGTTDKREELQNLIADVKQNKYDVMLAKELSRFARNGGLSYELKDIAERHRVHIITLDNAVNTLEGNSSMFGLYAWMYEQESQRTSDRVKSSCQSRAEKGLFKGSVPPYGYSIANGKLLLREDKTPNVIKRIYREYISGKGFDRIAKDLYNDDVPSPSKVANKKNATNRWNGSSVRSILSNPNYTGDLVQGRTTTKSATSKIREVKKHDEYIVVPNMHPSIISKQDFETVQCLMKARRRKRPTHEVHLFTNTAYCADCGKSMHYKKNRNGYVCGEYNKLGAKACASHHVKEEQLKDIILHDIRKLMGNPESEKISKEINKKLDNAIKEREKTVSDLKKKISELKERKKKLLLNYYDDLINEDDYRMAYDATTEDINKSATRLRDLEEGISLENDEAKFQAMLKRTQNVMNLDELTPELLHRLIERIEIKADGSPRIFYKFSGPRLLKL